uniref:CSON011030 protein n=1 Tax=Culicoides sonorensis TaxID=179676 RepID=A0A336N4B5_CULSO
MEAFIWEFVVEKLISKVYKKFSDDKTDLEPIKDLIELKSKEILKGISDISGQLRDTQRAMDELGREIHWEFVSAPINEIKDTIDAKFQRYIKYATNRQNWERETIEKFVDELLIGHDSVENFLALFNQKVYQNDNHYFEANTQRILSMSEKLSTKTGEPAQVVLYKFYSMILMVELKVFIMQAAAYNIKTELGHGKFAKEKEALVMEFKKTFQSMKNQVLTADRSLWKLDPDKHIESDPLYPSKGTYAYGYTLKRVNLWRHMRFIVYNRHIFQTYFRSSTKMSLSFQNSYTKASSYGNFVITGMKFVREEKISGDFHLELFESKLLPHGLIDHKTTRTVPRNTDEECNVLHVGKHFTSVNVNLDILLDEGENQGQNYVITGVRFVTEENQLKLELTYTEFDFNTGNLLKSTKTLSAPNSVNKLEINTKSYPEDFYDNRPSEEKHSHVKFDSCHKKKSKDMRIAPFIDTQKVCSSYMALAGVALILRDNDFSCGFIAPKLITFPVRFVEKGPKK